MNIRYRVSYADRNGRIEENYATYDNALFYYRQRRMDRKRDLRLERVTTTVEDITPEDAPGDALGEDGK